ncbi:peptidylprolyl isomerase [Chitinophaga filiformis]|uniref:Periplasmic chaperone for outer membrane proteins SurA n=1 Tax=Chitinophaga filiformis TaxID=104663 RepID=A0A1G7J7Z6_CHIFI|nr:peptidylprolyl isomerase [Chitinophaga filiformis]SDF21107.1 periplasmic chaperone for outer membrane proteins SurA [Chitinophaga filiformis]
MNKIFALSAGTLLFCQVAVAQQKMVADKIAAIVGDKIILRSDIEGEMVNLQRSTPDGTIPPNAPCMIMEQIIAQKVMVMQAERDSLPVSEQDVDGQIDNRIRYFEDLYGSREKMKEVTGYSIYQLRERFRQPIKEGLLAKAMQDKITGSVKVTPSEVKKYFDAIPKDSLQFYESELEIGQIVILPKATKEMDQYAIDRLLEFKKQVQDKTSDFGRLAILYSEDPGAKENKGVYILNRNDKQWDPDFLAASFRLKENEISSPIKSQFGYHLIQCIKRQGDNITVQHILLKPNVTRNDLSEATKKLDSIRLLILDGKMTFGEAVVKYSDLPMAKFDGGMLQNRMNGSTLITIDQLDQPSERDIVLLLDTLKPGGISRPMPYVDDQPGGRSGVRIIYLKTRTNPHRENMTDDYARIQQRTLQLKQQEARDKWLREKIPTYYIHVEDEFKQCNHIAQWMGSIAKQ